MWRNLQSGSRRMTPLPEPFVSGGFDAQLPYPLSPLPSAADHTDDANLDDGDDNELI